MHLENVSMFYSDTTIWLLAQNINAYCCKLMFGCGSLLRIMFGCVVYCVVLGGMLINFKLLLFPITRQCFPQLKVKFTIQGLSL